MKPHPISTSFLLLLQDLIKLRSEAEDEFSRVNKIEMEKTAQDYKLVTHS
ncbi:hypothetical protein ISN45_At05g041100 [Arabidopsis thaliana x Arabidopsis arenosa]|uniref:Uncharacterized protein n=1 Tax=Arabidopsis thaliana x Arabidopsis arenosa TaxID=1240361 RepID=A0A8T2D0H4_9BRAS|nr:hypothetical protein ISN45_At05g041100 [Arabidopsis thaliana x Arabidopsis arenosa]